MDRTNYPACPYCLQGPMTSARRARQPSRGLPTTCQHCRVPQGSVALGASPAQDRVLPL